MWKARPDEKPAPGTTGAPSASAPTPISSAPSAAPPVRQAAAPLRPAENFRAEMAHIGKSVLIKGELSGSEDLYLDGEVEGSVELKQHSLTVGPHGQARANLNAREVIIHGKVDGNVSGEERVELKKSAVVVGDISTQRILIEDGAFFKGSIDIQKEGSARPKSLAAGAGSSSSSF
jgi:cytoskeletal protein CcmA (bactofilin family)